MKRKYLASRNRQHNGVEERKIQMVLEMARTMLCDSKITNRFYIKAISIVVHTLNLVLLRFNTKKTPKKWIRMLANVKDFRFFGSKCYIRKDDGTMGKLESILDEGIFLGYSCKRKA